jgi:hypothetical protein
MPNFARAIPGMSGDLFGCLSTLRRLSGDYLLNQATFTIIMAFP